MHERASERKRAERKGKERKGEVMSRARHNKNKSCTAVVPGQTCGNATSWSKRRAPNPINSATSWRESHASDGPPERKGEGVGWPCRSRIELNLARWELKNKIKTTTYYVCMYITSTHIVHADAPVGEVGVVQLPHSPRHIVTVGKLSHTDGPKTTRPQNTNKKRETGGAGARQRGTRCPDRGGRKDRRKDAKGKNTASERGKPLGLQPNGTRSTPQSPQESIHPRLWSGSAHQSKQQPNENAFNALFSTLKWYLSVSIYTLRAFGA